MITEVFLATINFPSATEQAVYTDSLDQTEKIVMQSLDTFLFDYRQKHSDCQIKMLARHQAKQFNVELADHGRQIVTGQIQTYPVNISNLAPISEEDLWFSSENLVKQSLNAIMKNNIDKLMTDSKQKLYQFWDP